MRKTTFILFVIILLLSSCRERQRKGAFQGVWYKKGYDTEAFIVRGDSMYFPGLDTGYHYEFNGDTLAITFSQRQTKSLILSFSSRKLKMWDMSMSQDTVNLQRRPSSLAPLEED
jgi:hypothetical protein